MRRKVILSPRTRYLSTWFSSSNLTRRNSVEPCLGVINNYYNCLYKQTRSKYHTFLVAHRFDLKLRFIFILMFLFTFNT